MVGWINDMFAVNDMFAGNQDEGIYTDPGEQITIDTSAGQAIAVALPNSLTKPFLLNPLRALIPLGNLFFTLEPTCSPLVAACVAASSKDSLAA
jgi:hypothetical protein